jgi:hypothetical protein
MGVLLKLGEGVEHGAMRVAGIRSRRESIGQLAHLVEGGTRIVVIGEHVLDRFGDTVGQGANLAHRLQGPNRGEEQPILLLGGVQSVPTGCGAASDVSRSWTTAVKSRPFFAQTSPRFFLPPQQ